MYFDWANVHRADRYLDDLERLAYSTFEESVRGHTFR